MSAPSTTPKTLRIGVLYEEVQMSDLCGIDVIGNCSTKFVDLIDQIMPAAAIYKPFATPMEWFYISSSLEPSFTTPEMYVRPTHTYDSAPRDLDIIFIGGTNPATVAESSLTFLKEASEHTTTILTTCTGSMWLARSGVLDGKKATTNRITLPLARQLSPNVEWLDQRWVVADAKSGEAVVWTAGGAGCGIDMTIEFASKTLNENLVKLACMSLDFDFEGRKQFYSGPLPTVL